MNTGAEYRKNQWSEMDIAHYVCIGLSFAFSLQPCVGANVTVFVENVPKTADSVLVAVDTKSSAAPSVQAIAPNVWGRATLTFSLKGTTNGRFRAIALEHHGTSIFPFIRAVSAVATTGDADTVMLDFGTQAPSIAIGKLVDMGDGTVAVPVTFTGGGAFFFADQIVDLWVSPTNAGLVAGGVLFLAPLVQANVVGTFTASFVIPGNIASGLFEVGYYALEFRMSNPEIPLFTTPYIREVGSQSAVVSTSANDKVEPALTAQPTPLNLPGTYQVVVGPAGRLVRVFKPTQ